MNIHIYYTIDEFCLRVLVPKRIIHPQRSIKKFMSEITFLV